MRDVQRIQQRVEVRLQRMQLIWLTLGGVVALGVVFALGMVVGKRAARLEAPVPTRDHVAELDAEGDRHQELTFYNKLTAPGTDTGTGKLRRTVASDKPPPPPASHHEPAVPTPAPTTATPPPAATPAAATAPAPVTTSPQRIEIVTEGVRPPAPASAKPLAPAIATPAASPPPTRSTAAAPATTTTTGDTDTAVRAELARGPAQRGEYTVQVSSFQTNDEAKAFAASLERKGYHPFIVSAQVSGKGTWYRVRLGSFKDAESAKNAKTLLAHSDIPAWILKTD